MLGFLAVVVASGAFIGLTIISVIVLAVDSLRSNAGAPPPDTSFYLLAVGTLAGVLAAGFASWHLLAPLGSVYRRGALSIICSFATVLLMLVCIPVHQLLGRTGLLGLAALSALVALVLAYRARSLGVSA
jgi:hypothetical protein